MVYLGAGCGVSDRRVAEVKAFVARGPRRHVSERERQAN